MNRSWLALGGLMVVLAVAGCSKAPEAKREETAAREKAVADKTPEKFYTKFETSKGDIVIEVNRAWAPRGADRFYELVKEGFFDGSRFFRVRPKFIVQFGISKDAKQNELWSQLKFPDDPVQQSNRRGYVTFATRGPSTRSTQVFINLGNNAGTLDAKGFAPFGRVVEGMEVADKLYAGYGEVVNLGGSGPDPAKLEGMGDEYAQRSFPRLDKIERVTTIDYKPASAEPAKAKEASPGTNRKS